MLFNEQEISNAAAELFAIMKQYKGKVAIPMTSVGVHPEFVAQEIVRTRQELADTYVMLQATYSVVTQIMAVLKSTLSEKDFKSLVENTATQLTETGDKLKKRFDEEKASNTSGAPGIIIPKGPINNG